MTTTLVMVGMMGAGKTAVGAELAARLDLPLRDSDAEIEAAAAMPIPEIFARDGEAFFRRREAEVIDRLLDGPAHVLATGGGAFLNPMVRRAISGRGLSIWLDVPLDVLWARVRGRGGRPLLRTDDPYATLAALDAERRPIYGGADVTVAVDASCSIPAAADRVLAALTALGLPAGGANV